MKYELTTASQCTQSAQWISKQCLWNCLFRNCHSGASRCCRLTEQIRPRAIVCWPKVQISAWRQPKHSLYQHHRSASMVCCVGNWIAPLHMACLIPPPSLIHLPHAEAALSAALPLHGHFPKVIFTWEDCTAALVHPALREIYTAHLRPPCYTGSQNWTVLGQALHQNRGHPLGTNPVP